MSPRFDLVNIAMVYLLAVVIVALRFPHGPAIVASLLGVAAFDFLFVPPRGTLTVDDIQYALTFAIMLAVAVIISRLVETVRRHADEQASLEIRAETERIRSTLLASISHDLRTPLAVMAGASSSLATSGERLSAPERRALAESVFNQSRELSEHLAESPHLRAVRRPVIGTLCRPRSVVVLACLLHQGRDGGWHRSRSGA